MRSEEADGHRAARTPAGDGLSFSVAAAQRTELGHHGLATGDGDTFKIDCFTIDDHTAFRVAFLTSRHRSGSGGGVAVTDPSGPPRMSRYVVEVPLTGDYADVRALSTRARAAAEALRLAGARVRFVRTIFIPEDGSCLLVFEAPTAQTARRAATGADLEVAGVTRALPVGRRAEPHAIGLQEP